MMAVMAANAPGSASSFGDYLRFLRRRARLTQTELSIAVGYSPGQISMLENGQRHPDPTTVAALFVAALGIEKDAQASRQLVALAETTALQHRALPQQQKQEIEVNQFILRQQEEIGFLEDIPPLPAYLVARAAALTQLRRWFGQEQSVAICGLAGMGKSTLAASFAREYNQHHPVLWVTVDENLTSGAEAILRQIALFVTVTTATLSHTAPFLHRFSANEPAIGYHQQLHMVAAGLGELKSPLLVFDDAHRLIENSQSLQMLRRLLTLLPRCRFLFVSRQEIDLPGVLHLTLNGMDQGEATQLIHNFAQLDATALPTLLQKTGGSPMLLRLALSNGSPHTDGEQLDNQQPFARYLIETILGSLDTSARQLLDLLAIWRGILDLNQSQLTELLTESWQGYDHRKAISHLQRSRLIDSLSHATPHPLLREPLLAELIGQPTRKRHFHSVAARLAKAIGKPSAAAYHLAQAGEFESACELITAHDGEALYLGEGVTTAATIEEILTLTRSQQRGKPADSTNELIRRLLILRGDLLVNTTQAAEAHHCYIEALSLATRNLDRAKIAEKMAMSAYRHGEMEEAITLCEQALEALGNNVSQDGIRLRIQIEATHLRVLITLARFDEAKKICERALALVRPVALLLPHLADNVRALANLALGYIARFEGESELARQHFIKGVKHAHTAKSTSVEADGLSYLSSTLRDLGDFAGSEQTGQQALALAQTAGNEYLASSILHHLSLADYYHADLERALLRTQHVLQIKQPMGDIEGMVASRLVQSLVLAEQGEIDGALHCAVQATQEATLLENSWLRGLADFAMGVVLSFTDDLARAEQHLQSALDTQMLKLDRPFYCGAQVYMAMIYVAQGRIDEAEAIVLRKLPKGVGYSAELLQQLVRGMWLLAKGDAEAARTCTEELIRQAESCGYWVYKLEANRLLQLLQTPVLLHELPRRVCCEP